MSYPYIKLIDFKNTLMDMPLGAIYYVVNIGDCIQKENCKVYKSFEEFCLDEFMNEYYICKMSFSTNHFITFFVKKKA